MSAGQPVRTVMPLVVALCSAFRALGPGSAVIYSQEGLSPAELTALSARVYEVVMRKPSVDPLSYAERIPTELLPFSQRTDPYTAIGSAFAIGPNRFVSAAHVFALERETLWPQVGLRDSQGAVYPVTQVLKYSTRKDYIVFSVDGTEAPVLPISPEAVLNSRVYAVGGALGEGVVLRDGVLTSRTPEQISGEWRWLRFSAPVSPGNSGGPLLDDRGRVLGVTTARSQTENLNYALPIQEVMEAPDEALLHAATWQYKLPNMPARQAVDLRHTERLPLPVDALRSRLAAAYQASMTAAVHALTASSAELFPRAPASAALLGVARYSSIPLIAYQPADGSWTYPTFDDTTRTAVGEGGSVEAASLWGDTFLALIAPRDVDVAGLFADPRRLLDLILQGHLVSRTVAGRSIRITSFGNPEEADPFIDTWGRRWMLATWPIPATDRALVLLALPTPSGASCVLATPAYWDRVAFQSDFRALADFASVSYHGTLARWTEYLSQPELLPRFLSQTRLEYSDGASVNLDTPRWTLVYDAKLMGITGDTLLFMLPAFQQEEGGVVLDVGEAFLSESASNRVYVDVTKRYAARPSDDAARRTLWETIWSQRRPYDSTPVRSGGRTSVSGARVPGTDKAPSTLDFLYALTVSVEGEIPDSDMRVRFALLAGGFALKDSEARLAGQSMAVPSAVQLGTIGGKTILQAVATDDLPVLRQFAAAHQDLEVIDDQGRTPLLLSLRLGREEAARVLVEGGADLRARSRTSETPLTLALRYVSQGVAETLVERGTDLDTQDTQGYTPLMLAMDVKFGDLAERLVARGASLAGQDSTGRTVLSLALRNARSALAKDLIERGVPLERGPGSGYTSLMLALHYANEDIAWFLVQRGVRVDGLTSDGWTPLHLALYYGKPGVAEYLIPRVQDINAATSDGRTHLLMAIRNSTPKVVRALLAAGADPDRADSDGWTSLAVALRYAAQEVVDAVLDRRPGLDTYTDGGWSPLHLAARYMPQRVERILGLGVDPNLRTRNSSQYTPMHLAVLYDDLGASVEAIRALRAAGGDPTLKDSSGKTPADMARERDKDGLLAHLEGPAWAPGTEGPLPDPRITIHASATPLASRTTGQTAYQISLSIFDRRPNPGRNAFIDAVVTANGVTVNPSSSAENNFHTRSGIRLGQGDRLEVVLRHRLLGTIRVAAMVPPAIDSFRMTPPLPEKGVPYEVGSSTLTWTANGADEYTVHVAGYDADGIYIVGHGYLVTGTRYTSDLAALARDSGPTPYYEFSVGAVDKAVIEGFAAGSGLHLESASRPAQSNRP